MRVTTKTQYAVRALYDLAYHSQGQATQAKEISDRQRVPLRYLEQILQDLRRGGLIEAKRGPRGGYTLSRPPGEITMAQVLAVVRGAGDELFALDGEVLGGRATRRTRTRTPARGADIPELVWRDITQRLTDVLSSVTLEEFVKRAEAAGIKREIRQAQMYFI